MQRLILIAALALALTSPALAQEVAEPVTPASVIASATPQEWIAIAPEDLLIMELAPPRTGTTKTVVIQLMPAPFSQPWVANIRALARAHWWDETSVYRVVDNWVAQWGGGEGEAFDPPALPDGVESPKVTYEAQMWCETDDSDTNSTRCTPDFQSAGNPDPYLHEGTTGFVEGWPVGFTFDENEEANLIWPVHCYGSVGVARDLAPDTGTASELYAIIGHAPRQLDRNIAVVGRVVEGIEYLSTLPRGSGEAGVYEERSEDTQIASIRLASDHPDGASYAYGYLDTSSESFARYVAVRANRQDDFYTVPAGGVDVCNVQVPVRRIGGD